MEMYSKLMKILFFDQLDSLLKSVALTTISNDTQKLKKVVASRTNVPPDFRTVIIVAARQCLQSPPRLNVLPQIGSLVEEVAASARSDANGISARPECYVIHLHPSESMPTNHGIYRCDDPPHYHPLTMTERKKSHHTFTDTCASGFFQWLKPTCGGVFIKAST
jgi:hypothetical protein